MQRSYCRATEVKVDSLTKESESRRTWRGKQQEDEKAMQHNIEEEKKAGERYEKEKQPKKKKKVVPSKWLRTSHKTIEKNEEQK